MLNINDVEVNSEPTQYTCYGLGPCIGLFITDRLMPLSAGAHILFGKNPSNGFSNSHHLIEQMLERLLSLGSNWSCLRAKVVGGAQLYPSTHSIGWENARIVISTLIERKIFIAATDLGGISSRTARFHSLTGELIISTPEPKTYII